MKLRGYQKLGSILGSIIIAASPLSATTATIVNSGNELLDFDTSEIDRDKYDKISTFSQKDDIFLGDNSIIYGGNQFSSGGCGPSSIANALIATFNLKLTKEETREFVQEVLKAFSSVHDFKNYYVTITDLISTLNSNYIEKNRENFPKLYSILYGQKGLVRATEKISCDSISDMLGTDPEVIISKASLYDNWGNLITTAAELHNEKKNVEFNFMMVGAGTEEVPGPFRSGRAGHYIAVSMNSEEFYEKGAFYILDSYKRAIAGEAFGEGTPYKFQYAFAEKPKQFAKFNENFNVERISPTVIRVSLSEKCLSELNDIRMLGRDDLTLKYLQSIYKGVEFYGRGGVIINYPGKQLIRGQY